MNKKIPLIISILLVVVLTIGMNSVSGQYPFDFFGGFLAGVCCYLYVFLLIIWILIGIWVYKDAEKRRKSGALWLIIVIILGLIGIIIWLLVRPPIKKKIAKKYEEKRRCPNCVRIIPEDAGTCPYCSKKFW